MKRWNVVVLAGLALGLLAPAWAGAAPIAVEFDERAGDAPAPELDIQAAAVAYDQATGSLAGSVTLGAPPTAAVIGTVEFVLGRYALANGQCYGINDVTITIPDADDVAAGLPLPYAELYRYTGVKPIGFVPTASDAATINFSTAEANPAVVSALKRGRYRCAEISTREPTDFEVRDSSAPVPFLAGPRPTCRIGRRKVAGGKSFPVRCRHAGKRVGVKLYKRGTRDTILEGSERVRGGRFRVPTTASMRGGWNITIWKGEVAIGRFLGVKVR